jgi:hypothetical protein
MEHAASITSAAAAAAADATTKTATPLQTSIALQSQNEHLLHTPLPKPRDGKQLRVETIHTTIIGSRINN